MMENKKIEIWNRINGQDSKTKDFEIVRDMWRMNADRYIYIYENEEKIIDHIQKCDENIDSAEYICVGKGWSIHEGLAANMIGNEYEEDEGIYIFSAVAIKKYPELKKKMTKGEVISWLSEGDWSDWIEEIENKYIYIEEE